MKKRLLAILLVLSMLLSAALIGCEKNNGDTTTEEITQGTPEPTTEEITTEEPEPPIPENAIKIIEKGTALFKVVYPYSCGKTHPVYLAANMLWEAIGKYSTAGARIGDDYLQEGTHDAAAYEILIGSTNYNETTQVTSALKDSEWKIECVGNKIVICGLNQQGTINAVYTFLEEFYKTAESLKSSSVYFENTKFPITGVANRLSETIPAVDGATFFKYYSTNEDIDVKIYRSGSADKFNEYIKTLENLGYKTYAKQDMNGSLFATLYNKVKTVTVGFYKGDKFMRVIVEPYTDLTLFDGDIENGTEVTTPCLRMIGLQYTGSDGSAINTGACLLIRMADGRFIVMDGGHNKSQHMSNIISSMRELSKSYLKDGETPTIAAWIISHPHSDHHGCLVGNTGMLTSAKITVQNVIFSLLSDEEYAKTKSSEISYDKSELHTVAKTLKANIIHPHVGQVYNYLGFTMEVLYTPESYGPTIPTDENHMSIIIKMTFTDLKTSEKTVFMHVGDATGDNLQHCALAFGNYLKCDILQIAHHGASSKGNNDGTIAGYKFMAPATVLWTSGDGAYTAYKANAQNIVLFKTATNPNYKEVYVAGKMGKYTTLDMPYKVGTAIVKG